MSDRTAAFALASLLVALSSTASGEVIDRVLAILPGQIVTQSDVQAALDLGFIEAPAGGDRIAAGLTTVIDRVLMLNEMRRVLPPEPSPAAIDARIALIRQRFDSPATLSAVLAASGIDDAVLRIYAADDLQLAAYLDERFSAASQATDEEVRQAGEASRQRLGDERRQTLISAWTSELRRRAEVTIVTTDVGLPDTRISPRR